MSKPRRYIRLATPVGTAVYPHLATPDTKFNADGEYKLDLALPEDSEETAALISKLEEIRDEFVEQQEAKIKRTYAVAEVFHPEYDADGNPTGRLLFKTKLKAKVTDKKTGETWEQRPALFDAGLDEIPNPEKFRMRSGSEVSVSIDVVPYAMASSKTIGVSLRLKAVQVLKLITGGNDPDAFGFGKQDGFKRPKNVAEATPPDADEDGDDDGDY